MNTKQNNEPAIAKSYRCGGISHKINTHKINTKKLPETPTRFSNSNARLGKIPYLEIILVHSLKDTRDAYNFYQKLRKADKNWEDLNMQFDASDHSKMRRSRATRCLKK